MIMNQYTIPLDYFDLVYGYNKKYSKAYTESVENAKLFTESGIQDIKSVFTKLAVKSNEVKDERISNTRGNIEKFEGYNNISKMLSFIRDNFKGASIYNELDTIFNYLKAHRDLYEQGYNNNVSLIIDEYENSLYLLTMGILSVINCEMDININSNKMIINKKNSNNIGLINATVQALAKEMNKSSHTKMLEDLIKVVDGSIKTEGFIDTLNNINLIDQVFGRLWETGKVLVKKIINSAFGIIPIVRSIIYLRLKKKVDTINALDQQCQYIEQNIELLKNKNNIDPKEKEIIIQRQQAYIDAFRKKSEQLRAELNETEKDASITAKDEEIEVQPSNPASPPSSDDDFTLESYGIKYIKESENEDDDEPSYTIQHFKKKLPTNGQIEESDEDIEEDFEDIDLDNMEEGFVGKDNNRFIDEDENDFFREGGEYKINVTEPNFGNKPKQFVPIYGISIGFDTNDFHPDGTPKTQSELDDVKFAKFVKTFTKGDVYTHMLISFDDSFTHMYSFSDDEDVRVKGGGISDENILTNHMYDFFSTMYICVMFVSPEEKARMMSYVENIVNHPDQASYGYADMVFQYLGTPVKADKRFVCSTFTAYIMAMADAKNLHRDYSRMRPEDVTILPRSFYVMNIHSREDFINKHSEIVRRVKEIYNKHYDEISDYNNILPKLTLKRAANKLRFRDKIVDFFATKIFNGDVN